MTISNPAGSLIFPLTSTSSGKENEVAPGVASLCVQIVNVCFVEAGDSEEWVLIDAGMPRSAKAIIRAAERRYARPPSAIVLTHGHFDHVGAIGKLISHWSVPVYAHALETPYLTGRWDYPRGNGSAGGGLISMLSPLYPHQGIDLGNHVHPLPWNDAEQEGPVASQGPVPGLPGWRWLHTPGHTPGHIALFRSEDRTLIAGDAFVTVKQESLYQVVTQHPQISGPPNYFTFDQKSAESSVRLLAELEPAAAVTGHGRPMKGEPLQRGLQELVRGGRAGSHDDGTEL